jgi:WD40 repeat protein
LDRLKTSPSPFRTCPICGARIAGDNPCPACALSIAFATLAFDEPPPALPRFSPLDLPSDFRHYRVEREIAAGGMGVVYEAWDPQLGRRVALKMLRQVFFATEVERLRFQGEAELASRLDHPNIVPIYEVGVHEGQPYFTMKVITGVSLAQRLADGAISPRQAATLLQKISRAVQHAHQRGIIHRDLKPGNVLLDEQGEPWLTDFGVAKWLGADSSLTLTRSLIGTPDYMSPEQAAGRNSEISTATDVWALGVMLYQMFTGRLPFPGESHPEVLRHVAEREPPTPRTVIPHLDRDLDTLCLRCLDKDPARRLASAGELADELKRWLNGEPILARRITVRERLGKWTRRHPYRAVALGVFALVVLGAGAGITWQWRRAAANERRALASAAAERRISYSATLAQALAAREHHDFGQARRLLSGIAPELRAFDWKLIQGLCRGDEVAAWRLGDAPGGEPQCLTLLPDRNRLAILSADGHLHLHDLDGNRTEPPRELPPLPKGSGEVRHYRGLTFSPDGTRLAYACGDVLQVLEAQSLTVLHEEISRQPQCGWLDNDRLLYGFNGSVSSPPWPNAGAWILDFRNVQTDGGQILRTAFPEMCAPLAVAPDRQSFVLHRVIAVPGSWERTLHVYRTEDDFAQTPPPGYTLPGLEYPGLLMISTAGRYLAFSAGTSLRRTARVLEIATGRLLLETTFRFPIHALAIDPRERHLGLVGGDSVVRLYDFTRGEPAGAPGNTYDDDVDALSRQPVDGRGSHAPPGNLLTRTAQDGRARFYFGHEKQISDLLFDSEGALITASEDGSLRRWPGKATRPAVRVGDLETTYPLYHPAASADGLQLAYLGGGSTRLCDVPRSRTADRNVTEPLAAVHAPLAVLGDGRVVTQDRATGDVVVWARQGVAWREQQRLIGTSAAPNTGTGRTRGGVLSQDENRLVGAYEGRLFTADLVRGAVHWSGDLGIKTSTYLGLGVSRYPGHALSPDGEWIASSDFGARITIHRFAEPKTIVTTLAGEARDVDTSVAFSRDGRWLYTGNEDGRMRVWDTATWQQRPELGWPAHRSAVTAIAVSHDGSIIGTSGDETLKLFSIRPEPGETSGRERLTFYLDRSANWVQFARDAEGLDRALLHGVPGGTLQVWETDLPDPPGNR